MHTTPIPAHIRRLLDRQAPKPPRISWKDRYRIACEVAEKNRMEAENADAEKF